MLKAPIPHDEPQRMQTLHEYNVLGTPTEAVYDDIAHVCAGVCDTPIALIALIDGTRNWFKAHVGVDLTESPRDISFCGHAILGSQIFEITDATLDDRFADNPLVASQPCIRFYAGAPLITPDGYKLGTICAIDVRPRRLSEEQRGTLGALSRLVMRQLDRRRAPAG
ncbi:MAG TPA: GAF domain-containing protein [Thermoanaerobaculia bacterium]|nr:GAF domain-containing protein [Thermoanaerobaculia bacterium]